jgi:hypothetical protein
MTDYELAKSFFPSARKDLLISKIELLQTKAGENRIKLNLTMPLGDGKQVGMPTWVGDSFDVIGKQGSLLTSDKWGHDIKEMTFTIFPTDDAPKAAQLAVCPLMNLFSMSRESDGDQLGEICLHFVAYLQDNTELWAWCRRNYRKSIYVRFETTQAELPLTQTPDTQMKLGDEGYDAARKNATSKEHDAEFAGKAN